MATQTATAPLNSVEDLNQQLGHLWAERRRIEKELEPVTLGIQTADENARSLKKRLVQGDAGASSLLDKTEADRKELARKDEGLRLSLQELEPKITAAQQEITAARRVQDEQKQEQQFVEACAKAAAGVERVIELHAQACQAFAEVRQAQQHLNDRFGQRGAVAVEKIILGPLANLIHRLQTVKGWTYPRGVFPGGATIEIRPLLPPPAHMNGNGARKS
jgi:chromosome segregation ATPase